MMSTNALPRERLSQTLKNYIDPFLKQKGFKKKGSKYLIIDNVFSYEIDIQKTHTADHYAAFTMNYRIDSDLDIPAPLFAVPILKPALSGRVFSDNHNGMWAEFKVEDHCTEYLDKKAGELFCYMLGECTFPFIFSIKTLNDLLKVWNDEKDKRWDTPIKSKINKYKAVILSYLGEKEEAIIAADYFIEDAYAAEKRIGRNIFAEDAKQFKEKLLSM